MKKMMQLTVAAAVLSLPLVVRAAESVSITGAGATFPALLYQKWADKYAKITGVKLNYQAEGSGFGIAQVQKKLVDFGATDAPLKAAELAKHGLVQFPMVIGGVVPIVNVKGIGNDQLKLTGELLADIFLGTVTHWNDKAIADLNPTLKLPDQAITVVHRSDGSGTTWLFTNYLDKVSKAWHENVGTNKSVQWPAGIGAKGNPGVANYVVQTSGSIGYVEFSYAAPNKLTTAQMKNKAGRFVSSAIKTFQAAAAGADWKKTPGYYVVLTDQPGPDAWPITGASFILMHKTQPDASHAKALLGFFDWSFKHGANIAEKLDYVPIPKNVVQMVEDTWVKEIRAGEQPVWK